MKSVVRRVKSATKPFIRRALMGYAQGRTHRVDLSPAHWGVTRDAEGALWQCGVRLRDLVERYGSPLHVVDASRLDARAAAFLALPAGATRGCEVFYSYKTNPVPAVLQRLHTAGVGAEVISEYELWLARELGVPPARIVYNGPGKSELSLVQALNEGIGLLNLNSREEIGRVAGLARTLGKRPRVGIRVVLPGGWAGQFGESVASGAALRAFQEAATTPELDLVALNVHVGGEIAAAAQVKAMVDGALDFVETLRRRIGIELEILDFGGSLACPTTTKLSVAERRRNQTLRTDLVPRDPATVLGIREYVACLLGRVSDRYRAWGQPMPRVFLEPGRAMTADTQLLLGRVMAVRSGEEGLTFAILDAGINVAEPVHAEYHQLFVDAVGRRGRGEVVYRLTGPICTPGDVLYSAWRLPELAPGDLLAIMDSGAYFVPFSTSFSFPQPGIALIENGEASLIRRPETFPDLVRRDLDDRGAPRSGDERGVAQDEVTNR